MAQQNMVDLVTTTLPLAMPDRLASGWPEQPECVPGCPKWLEREGRPFHHIIFNACVGS